jgi:hypothetical protein
MADRAELDSMTEAELIDYRMLVTGETYEEVMGVVAELGRGALFPDLTERPLPIADHQDERGYNG